MSYEPNFDDMFDPRGQWDPDLVNADLAEAGAVRDEHEDTGLSMLQWRTREWARAAPPEFQVRGDGPHGGFDYPELQEWASSPATAGDVMERNLILAGAVGTGKSWSAWHIVAWLIRRGWTGHAVYCEAATWHLAAGTAPRYDDAQMAWQHVLERADILVLDDIGSQGWNNGFPGDEHDTEILDRVIRPRYQKATIVCTNDPDLALAFGARVADRLAHNATVVEFRGESRR